jgi:hypothetical protein
VLHATIFVPPTPRTSKWSFSFRLSHQYPIRIPLLTHSCYMPPPHSLHKKLELVGL